MSVNLIVVGLAVDVIGVLILVLVSLFGPRHQIYPQEKWTKRYWWHGWRPIFKIRPPSEKAYWRIKRTHIVGVHGAIPPKHMWNLVGLLYVLLGFWTQIRGNLK